MPTPRKNTNVARPLDKEVVVRYIVDRLTNGEKANNVVNEVKEKFKIPIADALKTVNDSKDSIKTQMKIRVPFILSIHIERYEYLYSKFEIIGRTDLMNKALQQKEELLNLKNALTERLTEDFKGQEIENKFNYNKLNDAQKFRLRELLEKGVIDG